LKKLLCVYRRGDADCPEEQIKRQLKSQRLAVGDQRVCFSSRLELDAIIFASDDRLEAFTVPHLEHRDDEMSLGSFYAEREAVFSRQFAGTFQATRDLVFDRSVDKSFALFYLQSMQPVNARALGPQKWELIRDVGPAIRMLSAEDDHGKFLCSR
jgi:hypothetical protein